MDGVSRHEGANEQREAVAQLADDATQGEMTPLGISRSIKKSAEALLIAD